MTRSTAYTLAYAAVFVGFATRYCRATPLGLLKRTGDTPTSSEYAAFRAPVAPAAHNNNKYYNHFPPPHPPPPVLPYGQIYPNAPPAHQYPPVLPYGQIHANAPPAHQYPPVLPYGQIHQNPQPQNTKGVAAAGNVTVGPSKPSNFTGKLYEFTHRVNGFRLKIQELRDAYQKTGFLGVADRLLAYQVAANHKKNSSEGDNNNNSSNSNTDANTEEQFQRKADVVHFAVARVITQENDAGHSSTAVRKAAETQPDPVDHDHVVLNLTSIMPTILSELSRSANGAAGYGDQPADAGQMLKPILLQISENVHSP